MTSFMEFMKYSSYQLISPGPPVLCIHQKPYQSQEESYISSPQGNKSPDWLIFLKCTQSCDLKNLCLRSLTFELRWKITDI